MEETTKMKKMNVILPSLFIIIYFFIVAGFVEGSNIPKGMMHNIPFVNTKLKVDGILSEEMWTDALSLSLNYEVEPGENIKPSVKTEVLLAYDDDHLYVAFRASDPEPSMIRARFTDRDNIWEDDYVGIVLDTFNDSRRTYNFYCNPLGIQAEKVVDTIGGEVEWDVIWNSAGRINPDGYSIEMAIPFSSLRFQNKKGEQMWGIDVERSYPRNLHHIIGLFPRDRNNNCYMCQAEKVIGFSGVRAGKNIEFDPTLFTLITQERESFPAGKFIKKTGKAEPGLTARWRFTPNLTLSAAVNPDFSQVEADAAQLDINTQFALYYPEKRPFFLEGASLFKSLLKVIYTRAVADPDWGIKMTGKEGKHAVGFFSLQDNITNLLFPGLYRSRSTFINMKNMSTVLRYRYDVGESSNLGIVLTDREGEDYFNRLLGVDGNLKITNKDMVTFLFLGSQTHYPDEIAAENNQPLGNLSGTVFDLLYNHRTEHVELWGRYQRITPNFRADLGLIRQAGFKALEVGGAYIWRHNPGYWYTILKIDSIYLLEKDEEGNLLLEAFLGRLIYNGPLQSSFNLNVNIGKKSFMGVKFDDRYLDFNIGLHPSGSLMLKLNGFFGDQVDITNGQAGTRLSFNPVIQYKIGRHLLVGLDHVFEKLTVNAGHLYTANLTNLRLIYQFSRRFFLRTTLQYADFYYNSALYSVNIDPVFRHLFSQVLFSYKINPQTVLFLGYSDDYYGYDDIPLKQNNRTLFLKIGYALAL
jgi:hypothetical protein